MTTWDADEAVGQLYGAHYTRLVRLATLLLHDQGLAEEVVQDTFVAMHGRWNRLRDADKAAAYLRAAVLNRCRSALRRKAVAARHAAAADGAQHPSAEDSVLDRERRRELLAALDGLPQRQREVLVLRYYLDLSEADIADTLRISKGAVKSHSSRGLAALRTSWGAAR